MRDLERLLKMIVKKNPSTAKDSLPESYATDDLELLEMQKQLGNQWTLGILEQQEKEEKKKDEELTRHLATPIKENKKQQDKPLRQFIPRHGDVKKEDFPKKMSELVLPKGIVHVGCELDKKKLVLVTEEKRDDQKKEPLRSEQKSVYKNRPQKRDEGSQDQIAQDWKKGSVAIVDNLNKKSSRILGAVKKQVESEENSGNLAEVFPFLAQKKEETEKQQLLREKSQFNPLFGKEGGSNKASRKAELEKKIAKKNELAEKKKFKEGELSKKLTKDLEKVKKAPQKLSQDDFFGLLWKKRRREAEGKGPDWSYAWLGTEQEQKEKQKVKQRKKKTKKGWGLLGAALAIKKTKDKPRKKKRESGRKRGWGWVAGLLGRQSNKSRKKKKASRKKKGGTA